ncbi:MAG: penicillin-binding protein [Lentilactobacillus hilgardii]|jgi:penicillin-binding protein 2B|uniref:PASTA domain-containing protein n=1 Tax=Lentilactobacillus hilgardii TaxID=1588 RepID=A0A6P1E910_LENHI|nr:penicillin-binding protein [Lentilactobacillus hilgardii]MCI1923432.1 penicillin-binding protein [Lentilactobacillus buchneri]RRG07641.1 MAG: penicillin-binding protein [Lactobacillus sp.]EEI71156.1 penicillin-binding protein, transpeptidase domain protein [Lentilactobacillus hilgardii ATCC 27305]MBZ2200698.1 penicillin-binding protein [Lentilactobacillus hilgardii]MBZ2203487.1 PASTA domain-containing protein [Lentilactobacillus hilgardii]
MKDPSNRSEENLKARKNRKLVGISLLLIFFIVFFVLSLRLVVIAVGKNVKHVNLNERAEKLYNQTQTLKAKRGTIYDANGDPIAEDTSTYSLYAVLDKNQRGLNDKPLYVVNKAKTARVLSKYLPITQKKALKILSPKDGHPFQVEFGSAGTNISLITKKKIDAKHLAGINFVQQQARLYPNGVFSSNLIGVATSQNNKKTGMSDLVGQMGIEQAFNKQLAGTNGFRNADYDVYGYKLPGKKQKERKVKNGDNIYTTIDSRIQTLLESEMNSVQSQVHPASLNAILMDAKTGKIVAESQRPSFNAATLSGIGKAWTNTFTSDTFEPGSTMKIFTLSASIDSGHFHGNDTYESGRYSIDGKIVPDWDTAGWGYITYNKGFALSSNVAMAHLEQQMGPKTWKKYIQKFGFLKSTNSGLPNELTGKIQFNYPIEQADTAFGQGIEITPIQMMQALTAVSNNGKMMKPYFISKVTDPNTGKTVKKYGPKEIGTPIRSSTAKKVRDHMQDVVYKSYGIGQDYKIKGYRVAAKTGTAQVSNGYGGYASGDDSYLYSVAGMVPANNPRYVMYITMKQPKLTGTKTATQLMAEIFKPVIVRALQNSNTKQTVVKKQVPSVAYQTTTEAKKVLNEKNFEVVSIGDGGTVIKQSPAANTTLAERKRVFILTNGTWKMPRIIGWNKKDVAEFCQLTGLKLESTGSGYADSQSINFSQTIKKGQTLKANFE